MKDQGPEEVDGRNADFVWPLRIQTQIHPQSDSMLKSQEMYWKGVS